MKQCAFFWGSEPAEGGGSFTYQPGIAPSRAVLRFPLRAHIPHVSSLTLTDGITSWVLPYCRVSRSVVQEGGGGARWREATILDRRWAWADTHYAIYGSYNTPLGRGEVIRRSTQQLAALLLGAMGETGFDVSALPTTTYPVVTWDAANPAAEIESLCQENKCLVLLTPNSRVRIVREGVGRLPGPDQRQMDFTTSIEPAVIPRALVFEGGRTHIQHDLPLVAIGLEIDKASANFGKYVPIENLSYIPGGGWESQDPENFGGVQDLAARNQAKEDVWKMYAVGEKFTLPAAADAIQFGIGDGKLTVEQKKVQQAYYTIGSGDHWRLLPINNHQNKSSWRGTDRFDPEQDIEPDVIGYFFQRGAGNANVGGHTTYAQLAANTKAFDYDDWIADIPLPDNSPLLYPADGYTADYENGRIRFDEPVYFKEATGLTTAIKPAAIRWRVSFPLRDPTTGAFVCQQYWQFPASPQAVAVPKIIKQSDVYYTYDKQATEAGATRPHDNEREFILGAIEYLRGELIQIQNQAGFSAPYKGFVFDVPPDGIVRAVQFDVSEQGEGTTYIDFNMESPEKYLTLQEMRNRRFYTYERRLEVQEKIKRDRGVL